MIEKSILARIPLSLHNETDTNNRTWWNMASLPESRTDLLNWLNEVTKLGITKIEQCGTGAALCQVIDSLYGTTISFPLQGDVPLAKVKFTTNLEWEYVNNFKVLQEAFTKHSIDKAIPVQRLIKLRFQDNLEFLQWMRRFWEGKGGSIPGYSAMERRNGAGVIANHRIEGSFYYLIFSKTIWWTTAATTTTTTICSVCITNKNCEGW